MKRGDFFLLFSILVYPITMFTIFFGTMIIFLISFPSNHFVDSGAALTAASISALVAVKGMDSLKRTLPLKDTGYSKASSTRNFSSHLGNDSFVMLWVCPNKLHSSSAMCGAKGARAITRGSRIARLLHFKAVNSFVQIMNAGMDVLKEKFSMSYSTFLMVLCSTFNSSLEGISSLTLKSSPTWNRRQNLRKNLYTPSIPCVSQG